MASMEIGGTNFVFDARNKNAKRLWGLEIFTSMMESFTARGVTIVIFGIKVTALEDWIRSKILTVYIRNQK